MAGAVSASLWEISASETWRSETDGKIRPPYVTAAMKLKDPYSLEGKL